MPEQQQHHLSASKSIIRQQIRLRISSISAVNRSAQERDLIANLDHWLDLIKASPNDTLLAFWPTLTEEPDFRPWLYSLEAKGIRYALPRLDWATKSLKFFKINDPDSDLEIAPNGLAQPHASLEPVHLDHPAAVLVPGLAFDLSGGRLGRGAGFYDRTLIKIRREIPRWGIGFSEQKVSRIPIDPWDQPLNGLILPTGIIRTSNSKSQ